MKITAVCAHCRHQEKEPVIEFNFKDGKVYFVCPECKKESVITLKAEGKPLPKLRRM